MLINGGAAVALLAFLGNLITNNSGAAVPSFANAMQAFVLGVFLAAVAYALTYLSQICYNGCVFRRCRPAIPIEAGH